MRSNAPLFYLQIIDADGVVAQMPGGGPLELALIESCVSAIVARGVGVGRTSAHVAADIRAGIAEALMSLKRQTTALAVR